MDIVFPILFCFVGYFVLSIYVAYLLVCVDLEVIAASNTFASCGGSLQLAKLAPILSYINFHIVYF